MIKRFFFLLSGFNEELPYAELRAVLDVLDPSHKIIKREGRIVVVETLEDVAAQVVERTAYTKLSALLLAETSPDEEDTISSLDTSVLKKIISSNSRIAVRGISIGEKTIIISDLEKKLGSKIVEDIPYLRVDLKTPDYIVLFVASPEKNYLGILRRVKHKRFFYYRKAGKRPFSIPSAMQPELSRCLINLSRTRIGGKILDPFAGTGGIMIEGILLGYDLYGVELKRWIALGALKNLKYYTPSLENIIVGDSRKPMFRRCFDSIVTDPPYGRSTTIPDKSLTNLLTSFFYNCGDHLKEGGSITIVVPENVYVEDITSSTGYNLREVYRVKIHRSLTRKVMVFR
ncbi:MAG: THUMP domain-containing protein [Nitrososphaeria archaeon]|nr:THUMP domain-containing protein [Nitrososphaeria archaeon]